MTDIALDADAPAWLSTADVAQLRGSSRITAWRWLRALRGKQGADAVRLEGRRLLVRREVLAAILRAEGLPDPRLSRRCESLEGRVEELERRLDTLVRGLGLPRSGARV
jgi:hypothetical protein